MCGFPSADGFASGEPFTLHSMKHAQPQAMFSLLAPRRACARERTKAPCRLTLRDMAGAAYRLFKAIGDTAAAQVVDRKLDRDFVAGQNLDVMHAHLARDMSENLMAVLELDFEHCVRESLQNGALKFDDVFFSQESSSSQILSITLCALQTQRPNTLPEVRQNRAYIEQAFTRTPQPMARSRRTSCILPRFFRLLRTFTCVFRLFVKLYFKELHTVLDVGFLKKPIPFLEWLP